MNLDYVNHSIQDLDKTLQQIVALLQKITSDSLERTKQRSFSLTHNEEPHDECEY